MLKKTTYIYIFFSIFLIYCLSPVITPGDSKYNTHTAYSIVKNGDTNLDEYDFIPRDDYRVQTINGHNYNYFPIWTSLLLTPSIIIADHILEPILSALPSIDKKIRGAAPSSLQLSTPIKTYELFPIYELITSSIICALCAVLMLILANQFLSPRSSLLIVLIFALASPMWSTVSRALWMHTPSILMLLTTLIFLHKGKTQGIFISLCGMTVALAYMFRPTNAISVIFVTGYILLLHRERFLSYLLCAAPFAVIFIYYNIYFYGAIFSPYGSVTRLGFHDQTVQALLGNLISPARGVFIYCPLFLFSLIALARDIKNPINLLCISIITTHWISISMFNHWWGGFSFGPRLFSDMLPFFFFGLIKFFQGHISTTTKILVSIFFFFSLFIHANGALNWSAFNWNRYPVSIDSSSERLWDWTDPQFLRLESGNKSREP